MDIRDIVPWAQVGSAVIATAAFGMGIYQLRKLVQSIHGQTYQRIYELMIGIDKFFIENPELKEFFYGGLPDEEVDRIDEKTLIGGKNAYSVAEMMIDYFDNVYHQRSCMPRGTFPPFSAFMRRTYLRSKLLRNFVRDYEELYPPDFRAHLSGGDGTSLEKPGGRSGSR